MRLKRLIKSIFRPKKAAEPIRPVSPLRKNDTTSFVFIHINKTAGTSIAKAIGLPRKSHLTAIEVIDIIGRDQWDKAFKFAVVRNPWAKVYSHYKYRIKTNQNKMGQQPVEFNNWVAKTYGPEKDPNYYDIPKMFQPQVDWLIDHQGKMDIDLILKFETLAEDYEVLRKKIGVDEPLPHLNKTQKTDYRAQYSEASKEIIANWFKDDIALFGYRFD